MGAAMGDDHILERFRKKKVMKIYEVANLLGSSTITARRRLKQWNTYTSINCNGRYYVLPEIAVFDEKGIWNYEIVFFSRHGNLRKTICELIKGSEAGLSAQEISQLVGLRANSSFLSSLRNLPQIRREKQQGRFVYFSAQQDVYIKQQDKRESLRRAGKMEHVVSDADAVAILVDRIRHPNDSLEQCAHRLRRSNKNMTAFNISALLEYHGLLKKTLDTPC
jgi:hypothetical protein